MFYGIFIILMGTLRDFIGTHKTLIPNKTLKIFKESNKLFTWIE